MQINWFTFAAQIFNFLVLVWILKRLLYQPVVQAMRQREQTIAARLQSAHDEHDKAMALQVDYESRLQKLEQERDQAIARTTAEIQEWKQSQIHAAREEIETTRNSWFRALEREKIAFVSEMQRNAADHVVQVTQVVLAQLANRDLEQSMVELFLSQLSSLDDEQAQSIRSAFSDGNREIMIQSAFALHSDQQQKITNAVYQALNAEVRDDDSQVRFVVNNTLICGIELQAGSHKVAWSARESLELLNERFAQTLNTALATASQTASGGQSAPQDSPDSAGQQQQPIDKSGTVEGGAANGGAANGGAVKEATA